MTTRPCPNHLGVFPPECFSRMERQLHRCHADVFVGMSETGFSSPRTPITDIATRTWPCHPAGTISAFQSIQATP